MPGHRKDEANRMQSGDAEAIGALLDLDLMGVFGGEMMAADWILFIECD
jgi:hypothetical protein